VLYFTAHPHDFYIKEDGTIWTYGDENTYANVQEEILLKAAKDWIESGYERHSEAKKFMP
jgi:hypothetical protein